MKKPTVGRAIEYVVPTACGWDLALRARRMQIQEGLCDTRSLAVGMVRKRAFGFNGPATSLAAASHLGRPPGSGIGPIRSSRRPASTPSNGNSTISLAVRRTLYRFHRTGCIADCEPGDVVRWTRAPDVADWDKSPGRPSSSESGASPHPNPRPQPKGGGLDAGAGTRSIAPQHPACNTSAR